MSFEVQRRRNRQITPNGKLFLATVLCLHHQAQEQGKRLQLWQVIKSYGDRELIRLKIKIIVK